MAELQHENQELRERVAAAELSNEQLLTKITDMEGAITQLAEEHKDFQAWRNSMEQQQNPTEPQAGGEAQDACDPGDTTSQNVYDRDETKDAATSSQQQESDPMQGSDVPVSSTVSGEHVPLRSNARRKPCG